MDTELNPNSIPFNLSTVIKLNVGGKEFMTSLGTLMSDQNSMLAKMFSSDAVANGRVPANKINGAFFIDSCPKYFGIILNFLRRRKLEKSEKIDMEFLRNEAEYFGIEGKMNT